MGFNPDQGGIAGASDIAFSNPANAHILSYNASTSKWSNISTSQAKTNLSLNNVDNTSDAAKNSAAATLTNKTINGANNTLTNIPNTALQNPVIVLTQAQYNALSPPNASTLYVISG